MGGEGASGLKDVPLVYPIKDMCEGNALSKYKGTATISSLLWEVCELSGSFGSKSQKLQDIAVANGMVAVIDLHQNPNSVLQISGNDAKSPEVLCPASRNISCIECDFPIYNETGEYLPTMYLSEIMFKNQSLEVGDVRISVSLDTNPWIPVYESFFYDLFFRGMGVLYCYASILAFQYRKKQMKAKKDIPAMILSVELVSLGFMGLHLVLGGWFNTPWWPVELSKFFFFFPVRPCKL